MAANKSFSRQPQRQVSVKVKLIEVITISDDENNEEGETLTFQSSLNPHKSQDHNIPNTTSAFFTNTQKMSHRRSCIVQKRESVIRKLIETIDISDDVDTQPINTVSRASPAESQKPSSSSRSHHIPTCLTSWKKRTIKLDKKILCGPKNQGKNLNLTPLDKSDIHPNSDCASIPPETVRKPESIMKCHINQGNILATEEVTILINAALNKVKQDESDDEPEKSADAVMTTNATDHPKVAKGEVKHGANNDDESALPKMLLNCKAPVANSSKKQSKSLERCHVIDQRQVEMSPIRMVGYVPVKKIAGSAHVPAEIASSSRKQPSRLLVKDAVNAKIQKQKRRPTHQMGLRKTTSKKRPPQNQHSKRSGNDSRAARTVNTRKILCRDQKQDQQRVGRSLKPHDRNLIRKIADSGRLYYICIFCKKPFQDHSTGRIHVRVHTGDKPYKCFHCGKRFSRNFQLKQHQNLHADNEQFKCKFCTKFFLHWCSRRKHQNICANKKN